LYLLNYFSFEEHSKNGYAQFQAITAIIEALLRDWVNISVQEIIKIRNYLLDFASKTQ
jgi:hypothetical protein